MTTRKLDMGTKARKKKAADSAAFLYSRRDLNSNSNPVLEFKPPVGSWVQLTDVVPASVDLSKLADPTLQFVEGATWSGDRGLQLRFRGQPSLDEMMGMS